MKKSRYCWVICAVCMLLQLAVSGLLTDSFTVFQPYIVSENGFSNTQMSILLEIRTAFAFLTLFWMMRYYRRLGYRLGLTLAVLLTGAGFLMLALADSFAFYCAAFAVVGVGYTLAGMVPLSMLIMLWFRSRSGLAIGITASGTGVAAIVFSPLLAKLIISASMRAGFLVQAAAELVFAALTFIIIGTPEEKGAEPYYDPAFVAKAAVSGNYSMPVGQLAVMLCGVALLGGYVNVGFGYLTNLYSLEGFDAMKVAFGVSLAGAALIGGKCLFGAASDRLGAMRTNTLFYIVSAAGLALCALRGGGTARMFASMLFLGVGCSMTSVALPIWASDLSAEGGYAAVMSRFQMANMVGNLVFNLLPGPMADRLGSYAPVYAVFTAVCVFSGVLVQSVYAVKNKKMKFAR